MLPRPRSKASFFWRHRTAPCPPVPRSELQTDFAERPCGETKICVYMYVHESYFCDL